MKIHQLSVEAALGSLGSNSNGLSAAEAGRRLRESGPNRVEKIVRTPAGLRLLREFVQFFSVILWVAAALAFVAEWSAPGQGMARIGYALIGVILVSGIFSFWREYRVEQTLSALQQLLPRQVNLLRGEAVVRLSVEQLVPGDLVLLEQGDIVPADCRLIEAFSLRVNNATVTGEAMPQARDAGPSEEANLIRSRNILLAGTSVVSGQGRAVVFATGALTEFGKIAHLAQTADDVVSPLRRQLAYSSRLIAALAIGIGLVFFAIGAAIDVPFWQDFIFSIGIIVAMVPEGLLPTLTLALVLAAQRLARRNVLIRHLGSVETLGSATVICTDKTGTLTENRMRAQELLLGRERYQAAVFANRPEIGRQFFRFFEAAHLCHDLKETEANGSRVYLGDPMDAAGLQTIMTPIMRRLGAFMLRRVFRRRVRERRLVDGHGDLRPEHVYLQGAPRIIDCLEFRADLRRLDPVNELAYLALECRRLGGPVIAGHLLRRYRERTGDAPPRELVRFYTALNALVRARIAICHRDEPGARTPDQWIARAVGYLAIAAKEADCSSGNVNQRPRVGQGAALIWINPIGPIPGLHRLIHQFQQFFSCGRCRRDLTGTCTAAAVAFTVGGSTTVDFAGDHITEPAASTTLH